MEGTIKQAEEERNRSLDTAKQLYEDYRPLKTEVDSLRGRLGLQPLPDIHDEDENITPQQELPAEASSNLSEPQPPMIQMAPQAPPPLPVQMSRPKPPEQPRQAFRQQPPPMK
ncbi:ZC4H2-like protein, partial [Mya arenaria]